MRIATKTAALAAGCLAALSAVAVAQQDPAPPPRTSAAPASETLVVPGNVKWINRSALSAQREGILDQIELQVGMDAAAGQSIGRLKAEMAELTQAKAKLAAEDESEIYKASAQKEFAMAKLARKEKLNRAGRANLVSKEELEEGEAEVKVSDAMLKTAKHAKELAQAELKMAEQVLREHTIIAPFDGVILEVMKQPGEAIQANEPVVLLGKTEQVRFYGYVPIEAADRLKKGMVVDVRPVYASAELASEQKRFRGKIVAIGAEIVSGRTTEVQIFADVTNNVDRELRPGSKADMVVYLNQADAPPAPDDMIKLPEAAAAVAGPRTPAAPVAASR